MANLQIYSSANIYVDGNLLAQEISITVRRSTNSNPVSTVVGGYSGESPGAATVEIDVDNAVPSSDFELNPGAYMNNLGVAEIAIFAAGKTLVVKGFIVEDSFTHGVANAAGLSFKFRGKYDGDWT